MTIINTSPNKLIQIGYEGEDKVTILRFGYSEKWLENGEGIFTVRVLRNGENKAYNAQMVDDDRENSTIDMTVTDIELSKEGYGEMQLVYTGADFVKKSPVYKYYVSRSVDEAVDPPAQDVYTQIIESLSDLQTDVQGLQTTVQAKADTATVTALSGTVTGLQTSKADKSYVDTQLATKASTATATASADVLMSSADKSKLDAVYADYSSALTALGVI